MELIPTSWRIGMAAAITIFAAWFIYDTITDQQDYTYAEVVNDQATDDLQAPPSYRAEEEGYGDYEPIITKDGAVSWSIFAAVQEVEREAPDADNPQFSRYWVEPTFTKDIRALDGTHVRLMGYMFPLDPSKEQSTFLFGPYPPSCAFHYHVNANQVLEIQAATPIEFVYNPIAITGQLELLPNNQDGLFYRLKNARLQQTY